MTTIDEPLVPVAIHFPMQHGDLAGCEAILTFTVPRTVARQIEDLVATDERCEGRCGALVAHSAISGDQVSYALPDPLDKITLPVGLWEAAHDATDDDGHAVRAIVFHSPDRCRALRADRSAP